MERTNDDVLSLTRLNGSRSVGWPAALIILAMLLAVGFVGGGPVRQAQAQELSWTHSVNTVLSVDGPATVEDLTLLGPEAAVCGKVTWVNPTNSPEPNSSISVNLWKNSTKKILDTPLGKLDFGSGNTSYAFCTDIYHPRPSNRTLCLDSGFFSDWRVAWLVTHYAPALNDAVQQAARQAAVWRFTDGWLLDQNDATLYNSTYDKAVRDAYNALLAAIPGSPPAEYQPGNVQMVNEPTASTNFLPAQPEHPFTVRLTKGAFPLAGHTVNVTASLGTLDTASAITDDNGEAHFTLTSTLPGTAEIVATAGVDLPAGSRFIDQVSPDTWQRLVLGQTNRVVVQALATKTWIRQENLIIAHKFEDRNFNGVQDEDEPNLAGWSFTLTAPAGQQGATTDRDGNAYFVDAIAGEGVYVLTETLQAGWVNSTPLNQARDRTSPDLWLQWQADFGNARNSLIEVLKFLDQDGDGVWDQGQEPPLPGWQFALYVQQSGDWAQLRGGTTGSDGRLTFTDLLSGQYKIVEQLDNHPGYTHTTPLAQQLSLGYPARREVRFGNRGALGISGTKWNDLNGDGVRESGEPGLAGLSVRLVGGPRNADIMTTTGGDGSYSFNDLEPGTYTVSEEMLTGWVQTWPAPPGTHEVVLKAQSAGGIDFGNFLPATIGDYLWYDDNWNGLQDPGEEGIPGIAVKLYIDNGGVCNLPVATAMTDAGGRYLFANLAPGHYCVIVPETAAENPFLTGFQRTAGPNPHEISLAAGQAYLAADFGYGGHGAITGAVFYDWNQDRAQGLSEGGVPGVQVCLHQDADADGLLDADDPQLACQTTDGQGFYAFYNYRPGRYLVVQHQPPDLQSTSPDVLPVLLYLVGGIGEAPHNDFGEIFFVRLGDFVYGDEDTDGVQDPEEKGLNGVPLRIMGTDVAGRVVDVTVKTADGHYLISDLLPGSYLVLAPATTVVGGYVYVSTTPYIRNIVFSVAFREDLALDFGYAAAYPTAVKLVNFTAKGEHGQVVLEWEVLGDASQGFYVWRSESVKGLDLLRLTPYPITSMGSTYRFVDEAVKVGRTYWYWIEDASDGSRYGPQSHTVQDDAAMRIRSFLPVVGASQ